MRYFKFTLMPSFALNCVAFGINGSDVYCQLDQETQSIMVII